MSEIYVFLIEIYDIQVGEWRPFTSFLSIDTAWIAITDLRTEAKEGVFYRIQIVDANNQVPN